MYFFLELDIILSLVLNNNMVNFAYNSNQHLGSYWMELYGPLLKDHFFWDTQYVK